MGGPGKGRGKGLTGKGGSWQAKGKGQGKGKGKGKSWGKASGENASSWVEVKPYVLVTGASGFVATSVVRRLTDRNYRVRGTVRSLQDEAKVGPLKRLFPRLELFEADLLGGPEAFAQAMEGCKYVIHCASPFTVSAKDPQDVIEPAVKGTEAVMNAAVKAGVSRVVLTSSVAAIGPPFEWFADPSKADKDKAWTEEDWNTGDKPEDGPRAYRVSKRLAEEKAWEIAKEAGLSLVTICPSFVIGPMLGSRADGESVGFIQAMLNGTMKEQGCKGNAMGVVDVRDVSLAHVAAMETEEAGGKRFMVTSDRGYSRIEMAAMIRDRFKAYPIPTEGPEPEYKPKFDTSKAREVLKFSPKPVDISLLDMASAAIRNGLVPRKYVLKPARFGKVADVQPDSRGVDVLAKVLKVEEPEEGRAGEKIYEVLVGDSSGLVVLRLIGDEAKDIKEGSIVEVRNAQTRMIKGYIRLMVGKWGKVSLHQGDITVEPNREKNVSATEYELVVA